MLLGCRVDMRWWRESQATRQVVGEYMLFGAADIGRDCKFGGPAPPADVDIDTLRHAACSSETDWMRKSGYWRTVFCSCVDLFRPSQHRIDTLVPPAVVPDRHQIMAHHPLRRSSISAQAAATDVQAESHMGDFRYFDRKRGGYWRSSKAGRSDSWPFSVAGGRRAVATRNEGVNAGSG